MGDMLTQAERSRCTILVVDDEPHIRRLIEVNLSKLGYKIEQAADGQECMEKLATSDPDLVLLDWMMPRKDGMETMGMIQADERLKKIPVAFLTAKGQDADIFKGWESGASVYLTKPFNPRELITFVDRIIYARLHGEDAGGDDETVCEV